MRTVCEHCLQVRVTALPVREALLILYTMPSIGAALSARRDRHHVSCYLGLREGNRLVGRAREQDSIDSSHQPFCMNPTRRRFQSFVRMIPGSLAREISWCFQRLRTPCKTCFIGLRWVCTNVLSGCNQILTSSSDYRSRNRGGLHSGQLPALHHCRHPHSHLHGSPLWSHAELRRPHSQARSSHL